VTPRLLEYSFKKTAFWRIVKSRFFWAGMENPFEAAWWSRFQGTAFLSFFLINLSNYGVDPVRGGGGVFGGGSRVAFLTPTCGGGRIETRLYRSSASRPFSAETG